MKKIYTVSSTENFVDEVIKKGWECVQIHEGVLGLGDMLLLAPEGKKWNFVVREVPLNMYSSGQTIRRCQKLSKALLKEIEAAECAN